MDDDRRSAALRHRAEPADARGHRPARLRAGIIPRRMTVEDFRSSARAGDYAPEELQQARRPVAAVCSVDGDVPVLRTRQALLEVPRGRRRVRLVAPGTISAGTSRRSRSSGSAPGAVSRSNSWLRIAPRATGSVGRPGSRYARGERSVAPDDRRPTGRRADPG